MLPTGKILPVEKNAKLDFNPSSRGSIEGKFLDNFFILDPALPRFVELVDLEKKVRYRMTALTDNIIGAQVFYPAKGDIVAIELVTHLPDPQKSIWGGERTGMQVLKKGENANYKYKIEVLALE